MLSYLIIGITFAFAAAAQPGPLQTYLISQSLSKGWRSTMPASFAPLLSDGPIIALVLLLLSTISDTMIHILQIAGGGFLFFLSYNAYKNWKHTKNEHSRQEPSNPQTLYKAAIVNLLNPNPYLGWGLVMGPLLLKGWRENPFFGLALLLGFYLTMILCLMGIIVLFAWVRHLGPRVCRMAIGLSAIALAGFGVYALKEGLRYFL